MNLSPIDFGIRSVPPCSDCDECGHCTMNCGPSRSVEKREKAMTDQAPIDYCPHGTPTSERCGQCLVKKARDQAGLLRLIDKHAPQPQSHEAAAKTLDTAAEHIEALEAERNRLVVEKEDMRQHAAEWEDVACGNASPKEKALQQLGVLRHENDGLRAELTALRAIAMQSRDAIEVARSALVDLLNTLERDDTPA